LQQSAHRTLGCWALDLRIHEAPPNINQTPIFDARGTRRFAVTARQTAVKMQLGRGRWFDPFDDLFDQIDPATWPIEFIAQQLIRWAGCGAKTAMHATAQNRFCFVAIPRALQPISEVSFHAFKPEGEDVRG
jgi:hypothetical protein